MKEQLITFETAKLAKEKGFNWETFYYRQKSAVIGDETILPLVKVNESNDWNNAFKHAVPYYSIPTQSLLQKWLRDIHSIHIIIIPTIGCYYTFKIVDVQCDPENTIERPPYSAVNAYDYNSYEEVLEIALQEALKLI